FRLFSHHLELAGISIKVAWNQYSLLQDQKKSAATQYVYLMHEKDPLVSEHVEWVHSYFNKCETNRNHLFHARHEFGSEQEAQLTLSKGVRGEWDSINKIDIPLTDLRRIADEMFTGWEYLWGSRRWVGRN